MKLLLLKVVLQVIESCVVLSVLQLYILQCCISVKTDQVISLPYIFLTACFPSLFSQWQPVSSEVVLCCSGLSRRCTGETLGRFKSIDMVPVYTAFFFMCDALNCHKLSKSAPVQLLCHFLSYFLLIKYNISFTTVLFIFAMASQELVQNAFIKTAKALHASYLTTLTHI